jgi:hypothetical protein
MEEDTLWLPDGRFAYIFFIRPLWYVGFSDDFVGVEHGEWY